MSKVAETLQNGRLTFLKQEVVQVFGRRVLTFGDCLELEQQVQARTGYRLSANTLRRFFGLVKYDFTPSQTTIDILSRYCGFASSDSIPVFEEASGGSFPVPAVRPLLEFIHALYQIEVREHRDPVFTHVVKETAQVISRHPALLQPALMEIAKTASGKRVFFEQNIQLDAINGYYGEGLRYYMLEKNTAEGLLFGHSLLVFRYWLVMDNEALEGCWKKLSEVKRVPGLPVQVAGRFHAARIYYHHATGKSLKSALAEARRYHHSLASYRPLSLQESFEFPVIEALVLTGEVEEAHYYLQAAATGRLKEESDPWLSIYRLLEAFVLHELKLITELSQRLLQYHADQYPYFARKYAALLYKALMNRMLKPGRKSRVQLHSMIDATGFSRFAYLYPDEQ